MEHTPDGLIKERLVAGLLAIGGAYAICLSLTPTEWKAVQVQEYVLALLFAVAIVVLDHFPIHLLRGTKVSVVNLPIFLSAALLSAPLVMIAAGVGLLVAQLLARRERGLLPRDIISTIGQWLITVFWGYRILHLDWFSLPWHASRLSLLLLCALLFLLVDFFVFFAFSIFHLWRTVYCHLEGCLSARR